MRWELTEFFNVAVGLGYGYAMLPWLFNLLMDGVIKKMEREVRVLGLEVDMSYCLRMKRC